MGASSPRGDAVGLATVYRTLALLSRHGVVDALMHHAGEVCYRLCGEGHHHHLVCGACHRVVELGDCDLDGWLSGLAAEHGFTVSAHTVEVTWTCADCSCGLAGSGHKQVNGNMAEPCRSTSHLSLRLPGSASGAKATGKFPQNT